MTAARYYLVDRNETCFVGSTAECAILCPKAHRISGCADIAHNAQLSVPEELREADLDKRITIPKHESQDARLGGDS